jgi:hypothetical protein
MKKFGLLLVLLIALVCPSLAQSNIFINEFMLSNSTILADEDGDYPDWIELYNASASPINLSGYGISDDVNTPFKWIFPSTSIGAGDYLIIFASSKDRSSGPYLHTNFKLSSWGEDIILTTPSSIVEDQVTAVSVAEDVSYGRSVDGSDMMERFHTSTPAASNSGSNNIIFSHNSGFYPDTIYLALTASNGDSIFYTTDGTNPTATSLPYTGTLTLGSLMSQNDVITNISTSPYWSIPVLDNFKAHIIRAATFNGGVMTSNIYDKTIFVEPDTNSRYSDLPIISIITDPGNLFDHDTGIYVPGVNFSASNSVWTGNYHERGEAWERLGNIQFFDSTGTLLVDQNVGLRTHGGKGRNLPQKSLRFYARDEYGAPKINHRFFDVKDKRVFGRLVIRNSMSCWRKSVINDECTSYICRDLNIEVLDSRPTVVFINGEYWGLQSIREYFDEDYIAETYDLEEDSINIVLHGSGNRPTHPADWGTVEGTNDGHIILYDFLNNNNLSADANYSYVNSMLDMRSIIDYYCAEIYFNNKDWPTNNNKLWNFGTSGEWRQMLYDLDGGWSYLGTSYNALSRALSATGSAQNAPYATFLLRKLMESSQFRDDFQNRMACLMQNEFSADTVNAAITLFKSKYTDGMPEHVSRWNDPGSVGAWNSNVNTMVGFANGRRSYVEGHMSAEFGFTFDADNYDCGIDSNSLSTPLPPEDIHVLIYPNPSRDKIVWMDFDLGIDMVDYEVYDMMGRLLIKSTATNHQQIPLNFDRGTYLIKVLYEGKQVVRKVMLQ